jgi:uncharacterized protein YxeA
MSRAIVAALGLAILAISGAFAIEAALEAAGEQTTIVNETFTPTVGNEIELADSKINGAYYDHNVTVYDENGTEMDADTDYRWYIGNGTVEPQAGGGLEGDASATITYGHQLPTEEEEAAAALLANIPQLLGLFIPAIGLVIFLAFLRGG